MVTPTLIDSSFLVNAVTAGAQNRITAEGMANGRLFLAYDSHDGATAADWTIVGQLMSGSGANLPTPFVMQPNGSAGQPYSTVVQLADGNLLVVWADQYDGAERAIHASLYTSAGAKIGSDFRINNTTAGDQAFPAITALKDGGFVAVWADTSALGDDASSSGIKARIYDTGYNPGAEFLVNTTTVGAQIDPHVTTLSDGSFAVTWLDTGPTGANPGQFVQYGRIYSASGVATSAEIPLDITRGSMPSAPEVSAQVVGLANGDVAFVWVSTEISGNDLNGGSIRTAIYSATGVLKVAEAQINTTITGDQDAPTAVALRDGRFMVAWVDASAGLGNEVIRAQVMNADGTKSFSEFSAHDSSFKGGSTPNLTEMADGRVFISWSNPDAGFDGSEASIVGQYIDPRVAGIDLSGTADADSYHGSLFADTIKGFEGNDSLYGGGDGDLLYGGLGNDLLDGGAGADRAYFNGPTALTVNLSLTSAQVTGQGTDTLLRIEHVSSGNGNDRLTGNSLDNSLIAAFGSDTMVGGAGNDSLYGGGDGDLLYGGLGNDLLDGGAGADRAYFTGPTAVTVNLSLTSAQVTGQGTDTLLRIEHVSSGNGNDRLTGNSLDNSLIAALGSDTMVGGAGNDSLYGGGDGDLLYGGLGNDLLDGGAGDDSLIGGLGEDAFNGGAGADDFIFGSAAEAGIGAARDKISSFLHGTDDIVLTNFMSGGQFIGAGAFTGSADEVRYVQATGILSGDLNGDKVADWEILIVNKAVLSVDDFIF